MFELRGDYGPGEVYATGLVKMESNSIRITSDQNKYRPDVTSNINTNAYGRTLESERNRSPSASSTGQSGTYILDQEKSPIDDTSPCSSSPMSSAPICRQFWKAGAYDEDLTPVSKTHAGSSYLHIHPKFLHSNATSHKWAFGAIAEFLDNAVDEIQNGATYVAIDKFLNPRDGSPALLIQDDGAGMDPESMRRCLSFGFSDKKSNSSIGKYGNGFKTSSMRLGADAIVFSRNVVDMTEESIGTMTQSIGLLSYTFLTKSGYDRIVVPMVHYKFDVKTGQFQSLQPKNDENSNSNLSVILKWSPFSTEEELLKQFDDVGFHGTKVIIYNLWLDNEGKMELDFDSDPEDIRIEWDGKSRAKDDPFKAKNENHISNRLKYSLNAYLSVLYVNLPVTFCIFLRKKVVLYKNIATELEHPEFIVYKPHSGGSSEGKVITTIGFVKEAPNVSVHGFNIYHKNRLILPFLPVVAITKYIGKGVVGVLEANFIEPTHNKQDFEKTNVFQKLVTRLRDMTLEYWDYHCNLIGYHAPKKRGRPKKLTSTNSPDFTQLPPKTRQNEIIGGSKMPPLITTVNSRAALNSKSPILEPVQLVPCLPQAAGKGPSLKRKAPDEGSRLKNNIRVPSVANNDSNMSDIDIANNEKRLLVLQENKKLKDQCVKFEKAGEELNLKVKELKKELGETERVLEALMAELQVFENVKVESNRHLYM